MMSPVTDFFKSVMDKVNTIPTWIQERLGRRRLDSKIDNVPERSKQVEVKADLEDGSANDKNECWIPIFCSMQVIYSFMNDFLIRVTYVKDLFSMD